MMKYAQKVCTLAKVLIASMTQLLVLLLTNLISHISTVCAVIGQMEEQKMVKHKPA